jgi:hypothetical protein
MEAYRILYIHVNINAITQGLAEGREGEREALLRRKTSPLTGLPDTMFSLFSLKIAQNYVELWVIFPAFGDIDNERATFTFHEGYLERFNLTGRIAKCINIYSEFIRVGYPAFETVRTSIIHDQVNLGDFSVWVRCLVRGRW